MIEEPLPYRDPTYRSTDDLVAWIGEELARRRADGRPIAEGELVEAMVLGAGPDFWTCVVRGPTKVLISNRQLPEAFPGGIVTAYVEAILDGEIHLSRRRR